MTQEFRLSVTPIRNDEYLVRTEDVAPGVPLAEEQVIWRVDDWLMEASLLMDDPLSGLLRGAVPGGKLGGGLDAIGQQQAVANLVAFGQRLYGALFQGTIRDSWMMAKAIAQHQHHRLRFRLGLKGTQLHRLPWEVLYEGDRPLAAGTDIIFSRYHSSFSVTKAFQPKPMPAGPDHVLKILMVLAAPSDQAMLALQQEAQYLQQELQRMPTTGGSQFAAIELTTLEQPGREELTQALEHNAYHVLHYAGHSNLGQAGGSLSLVNNRTGLTEILSGEDLAGLLVNNGVRMAVFNSCRGVYTATSESNRIAEGNLAEALLRRGVPAVLAMAERIPDEVALNLSRLFYRNLRQEAHPIDLSLGRSRQGLISSYTSDQLYWALPILYLHPDFDGFLLPTTAPPTGNGYYPTPGGTAGYDTAEATVFEPAATEWPAALLQTTGPANGPPTESWLEEDDIEIDDFPLDASGLSEEERVAQLAHEVSHSPTVLEPEESRLGGTEFGRGAIANDQPSAMPAVASNDPRVYAELENVLQDMGKLTPAIAAGSQAIQANPNSAAAYTEFGWALYQQGYLTEAISTYNQAIRLDPDYATAFNRLGLAFYQQGRVDEAIRAYSRAVQLDPTLTEASTNLRTALYGDDLPGPSGTKAQPPLPVRDRPQGTRVSRGFRRRWLWGGVGAVAIAALLGGWFYREPLTRFLAAPWEWLFPEQPNSLRRYPDSELIALATTNLDQQQFEPAQAAIAELLDRNNIDAAANLLTTATATNPAADFKFLQGRLEWQRRLAGQPNASIDTARQFWEQAAQTQKSPQLQNALGFAYYAQGKLDPAEQSWYKAIRLSQGEGATTGTQSEVLTAHAGLALVARKKADQFTPNSAEQATQYAEMQRNLEIVLSQDKVNFQPDRLQQNWLWLDSAIQDWQAVLASHKGA